MNVTTPGELSEARLAVESQGAGEHVSLGMLKAGLGVYDDCLSFDGILDDPDKALIEIYRAMRRAQAAGAPSAS